MGKRRRRAVLVHYLTVINPGDTATRRAAPAGERPRRRPLCVPVDLTCERRSERAPESGGGGPRSPAAGPGSEEPGGGGGPRARGMKAALRRERRRPPAV